MDVVFLYGPPAVGKLTVARALSDLCGYGVFHNHLTFDIARAFFEPFSVPFLRMLRKMRMEAFHTASELGADGCIFTMCYDHPGDKEEVDAFRDLIKSDGGTMLPVHLTCSADELMVRVVQPSRVEFRKLTSAEKLEKTLSEWNCYTPIPGYDSLEIDNTDIEPPVVARRIAEHFSLPLSAPEHPA